MNARIAKSGECNNTKSVIGHIEWITIRLQLLYYNQGVNSRLETETSRLI